MSVLTLAYAMGKFTMAVIAKMLTVKAKPDMGFRQFFKDVETDSYGIEYDVRRKNRRVSIDISLYEKGKVVRMDKVTQKNAVPANYDEKFDYSALEAFENVRSENGGVAPKPYNQLLSQTAEGVAGIDEAFDRAEELACASIMLLGTFPIKKGTTIDFRRKADSLLAYDAGRDFSVDTVNPESVFVLGAEFLIKEAKANPGEAFDVILGSEAHIAFKNNPIVQKQADLKDMNYMNLTTKAPMKDLTPHGEYTAGAYRFRIWTYTGYYDDADGNTQTYMDPKAMIMLPSVVDFNFVYCGTKAMTGKPGSKWPVIKKGKRATYKLEGTDEECNVQIGRRTRFAPIPRSIDSIWTATILN